MKFALLTISGIMFAAVLLLSQVDGQSAAAQCAERNEVSLEMRENSLYRAPDGTFYYLLKASWDTKSKPFVGLVTLASGSVGVENVTHIPAYFFPNECSGNVTITVIGHEDGPGPHAPNHFLRVGPSPNYASTATAVLVR